MVKFPYGISDFEKIASKGFFYIDRTDRIPILEEAGEYLLFIRPRRFGKSLLLSTLRHYYDIGQADHFDNLFGHLAIGDNPTPSRNRYLVLQLDFSCVEPMGSTEDIRRSLHGHVNSCIYAFYRWYESIMKREPKIDSEDALSSLQYLFADIRKTGHPLYLFIDEYDNFANEVLTRVRSEGDAYAALVHQDGPLKTLFKAVKSAAGTGEIDRIFITGVSPVVMSDITSGFNIAENIYLSPEFEDLCGFTDAETEAAARAVATEIGVDETKVENALWLMRAYYNGYAFSPGSERGIFNPTLAIYFLKAFSRTRDFPRKMLDANLATDAAKLEYAAGISAGRQLLLDVTREKEPLTVTDIADRFGLRDMLDDNTKDHGFLASFLYYFGVLTIAGDTPDGELILKVPNLVMRALYVDNIRQMLLPEPVQRDDGRFAAKRVYQNGDMAALCDFVENRYFQVFHNPDYRWANELTVKTAFLTLLYNDILYIMDSEREIGRNRADLTMIIRPDMRKYEIFDVLIEFKYLTLSDVGMSGKQAKGLTPEALRKLPGMVEKMAEARDQAIRYGDELQKKYGNLRLRRYAVVSLGFERIWWEEVEGTVPRRRELWEKKVEGIEGDKRL